MGAVKLSAPVGLAPRKGKGAPVKNKGSDVQSLRRMMEANGLGNTGTSAAMDAALLKLIAGVQKKIGFKNPDQVVDPGGKTEKYLWPKYAADVAAAEKLVMVKIKWKGETLMLTEPDYARMKLEVFKNLDRYIKSLIKNHKFSLKTYQEYLDTAQMKDGVMNAVAQAIIMTAGSVKYPKSSVVGKSITATGALERAVMSRDIAALDKALPEAERAINAFNAEISRFLKDFTGSAQTTGTVLMVSSAACFAVVGVLATPVLVTGAGMSVTAATVTSGAGVGVLSSASQELGKHASGQKVTVWESVQAIVIDGTIGGLTAGIGSKIPLGFCDDMAKALAPKLASKVPLLAGPQAQKFLVNYFTGAGQESVKSAINAAIKVIGGMMKKGKVPTQKDFEAAVQDVLISTVVGGFTKNLGGFQKKLAYSNKAKLEGTILPERLAKLAKGNEIPNTIKAKMYADVMNKVSEEALKVGFNGAIDKAKGSEDPKKLAEMGTAEMAKDKKIQSLVDKELKKAMKKYKVGGK